MRVPPFARVACVLGAVLLIGAVAVPRGAIAMPSTVDELLDHCRDDEIYADERQRVCSTLLGYDHLSAEVRAEAFVHRGTVLMTEGRPDLAMSDFEAAIALNPRDPVAYAYRGEVHKSAGQLEKARAEYDLAISLDRASADLFVNRGEIHRQLGARDQARADFETALKIEPDHYVARKNLRALAKSKK